MSVSKEEKTIVILKDFSLIKTNTTTVWIKKQKVTHLKCQKHKQMFYNFGKNLFSVSHIFKIRFLCNKHYKILIWFFCLSENPGIPGTSGAPSQNLLVATQSMS